MSKTIRGTMIIFLTAIVVGWVFRFEFLFYFQWSRLASMDCVSSDSRPCINKIWAHRVNSVERLKWIQQRFKGVEADVVFDSAAGNFWVYHPPGKGELKLDDYLHELTSKDSCYAWLDMRGLNRSNAAMADSILCKMEKKANTRHGIVYEIYDTAAANFMAEKGYQVAFHVPQEAFADSIMLAAYRSALIPAVRYVAQEHSFAGAMETFFKDKKIITWSISFNNYFDRQGLVRLVSDPRIAIVLVNVKSPYYK